MVQKCLCFLNQSNAPGQTALSSSCWVIQVVFFFSFLAMDDETLAVALGYTCHVVSMIARFLQLPLRYPVNSHGSRSTIVDLTSEKVPEKDRK